MCVCVYVCVCVLSSVLHHYIFYILQIVVWYFPVSLISAFSIVLYCIDTDIIYIYIYIYIFID